MKLELYKSTEHCQSVKSVRGASLASSSYDLVAQDTDRFPICSEILASILMMEHAALYRRAVALIENPCRERGIDIERLGIYPIFDGIKLFRGISTDCVIVPAERDPLLTAGKFPLPKAVNQKLQAMERAGVPLDLLHTYIGHEIPSGSVRLGLPVPLEVVMPAPPERTIHRSAILGDIAYAATISFLRAVLSTAAIIAIGIGEAAMHTVSALEKLDPVIFGALSDEHGIAVWFCLAKWEWVLGRGR